MHSSGDDNPLEHYQTPIANAPSLKKILEQGQPRVINKMLTFEDENSPPHIKRLGRQGYAASYTIPIFDNGDFIGFLFFNAYEADVFTERTLQELDIHGHLIALMLIKELTMLKTLSAAIKTAGHITHHRDPETGSHLDRMSRYSRLIALALAEKHQLDDTYVENIFTFSPLHDIGKIAIPDEILLKPGPLSEEEMAIMRTHTLKGRQMIDELIHNFGLEDLDQANIMRNIATYHHEKLNGTGYPEGLSGTQIPLEARIVAVADIFDALTSKRPYKEAWSNDKAFNLLQQLAGRVLDSECVEAIVQRRQEVEMIQQRFQESRLG